MFCCGGSAPPKHWDTFNQMIQVWAQKTGGLGLRVNESNRTCTLAYQGRYIIFVELKGRSVLIYSYLDRIDTLGPDVKDRLMHTGQRGHTAGPGVKDLRQALKQVTPTKVALINQPTFDSAMDGFLKTLQYVYGLQPQ
mmetsp:Transcript_25026/g.69233  ORF Transcript_25026/g.69233 Transcript_25026/m.69233 type:complete len:138 (-) Transcript_25026:327-740(-)